MDWLRKHPLITATLMLVAALFIMGAADDFPGGEGRFIAGPADNAYTATIGMEDVNLPKVSRAIRNGESEAVDIKVRMRNGADHTFKNVPPGGIIPARIDRVYAEGTDATEVEILD